MSQPEVELKPCPFCGSNNISSDLEAVNPYGTSSHCSNYVRCNNCGFGADFSRGAGSYKIQGARERWNTRPDSQLKPLDRLSILSMMQEIVSESHTRGEGASMIDLVDKYCQHFGTREIRLPEERDVFKHKEYPTRKEMTEQGYDYGWNSCREEMKRLNGLEQKQ